MLGLDAKLVSKLTSHVKQCLPVLMCFGHTEREDENPHHQGNFHSRLLMADVGVEPSIHDLEVVEAWN